MIAAAVLAVLAALVIVWPLVRGGSEAPERQEAAIAIFKDQLAEVDRDEARGQIKGSDAEAARTEIKRRMLAASRQTSGAGTSGGRGLLVAMALLVPAGGAGVYALTGSPDTPSLPFAERSAEQEEANELRELVTRLRTRLEADPDGGDPRGWELLGSTYMNMGAFKDATYAFEKIVNLPVANSATWSQYAESLIAAEGGVVTPKANDAIAEALRLDPDNPAGTYYSAVAMEQGGDAAGARQMIVDRLNRETAFEPWMEAFVSEANRIGETIGAAPVALPFEPTSGPSREDVAAAQDMSEEDREAFIESMVDRLAEKMEDEPENLQGWLQLARAYAVLGRTQEALAALKSAEPLARALPEDNPMRRAVQEGLAELGG